MIAIEQFDRGLLSLWSLGRIAVRTGCRGVVVGQARELLADLTDPGAGVTAAAAVSESRDLLAHDPVGSGGDLEAGSEEDAPHDEKDQNGKLGVWACTFI